MSCIDQAEKRMYVPHQRNPLTTVRTEGILKGFRNIQVRVIRDQTMLALDCKSFDPRFQIAGLTASHQPVGNQSTYNRVATCRELLNRNLFKISLGTSCPLRRKRLINLGFSLDKGHFITVWTSVGSELRNTCHPMYVPCQKSIDSCFLSKKQESYLTRSLRSKGRAPRNAEFLREIPISRARSHRL